MRCVGDGSTDRVLFLLLEESRGVEAGGADSLGSVRGRGAVSLSQALGGAAEDGQSLRDGVDGGRVIERVETYGLRR